MTDLFEYAETHAKARRTDPITSKVAQVRTGSIKHTILSMLTERGPLAEYEISEAFEPKRRVSVSPRFAELRDEGLIRKSDATKINPETNNPCQVWERA